MELKTILVWPSRLVMDILLPSSMRSSPQNQDTSGAGSPKIGTLNFNLSFASIFTSRRVLASMYGSTGGMEEMKIIVRGEATLGYLQSASLAIFGLEATLGSDLPALLMAMTLN